YTILMDEAIHHGPVVFYHPLCTAFLFINHKNLYNGISPSLMEIRNKGVLNMSTSLKGKTAIITGASKGVGRATAIALAKEGVHLGVMDRTENYLLQVAEDIKNEVNTNSNVYIATGDVSKNEQVIDAIDQLKNDLCRIDILINNAGIAKFGKFLELDVSEWEKIIQVNLLGKIGRASCR